jgi:hypothetical protein
MGGAQHNQIGLAGASVQQNDFIRFSVLDINSHIHTSSLSRGTQLQQIRHSFRGPCVEGLVGWNGVDDDHACGVGPCQGEGLRERGPPGLVNVHCAEHTRESFHELNLRCLMGDRLPTI